MAAEDLITFEELGAKVADLEAAREAAQRRLRELQEHAARPSGAGGQGILLGRFAGMMPESLDALTLKERHQDYRLLQLKVRIMPSGDLDVRGVIGAQVCVPRATSSALSEPQLRLLSGHQYG